MRPESILMVAFKLNVLNQAAIFNGLLNFLKLCQIFMTEFSMTIYEKATQIEVCRLLDAVTVKGFIFLSVIGLVFHYMKVS